MTYSITILGAEKLTVQDTGEHLLSVQFNIMGAEGGDDPQVISTQRHGFPLDSTPQQVEAGLEAVLAAFVQDAQTKEASADFAAQDAQADATIEEIIGKQITG